MQIPAGTTYANLTVIEEVERSGNNRRFRCRCVCGAETVKFLHNLRSGRSTSCGCTYEYGAGGRAAVLATRRARAQVSDEGRICLICGEWKLWSKFCKDKRRDSGKASNCIECNNWRTMALYFEITRAEFLQLYAAQGGVCALCGQPEARKARLAVDHDHSCCGPKRACKKCIRGLLCDLCNRMLGYAEQREAVRARFLDYLEQRPFASVAAGLADPVDVHVG